jgi:DNA-binding CsgD family transcriptional regulator
MIVVWSERRAEGAHRELLALGSEPLDVDEVHAAGLAIVGSVVPFDAACVGAVDPDTLLLTSGVTIGFDPSVEESERFVEIEYGGLDVGSFTDLVERSVAVEHRGEVAPSRRRGLRFNELTRRMGFERDVRMAFTVDGTCWAVGDLYRGAGSPDFEERELAFLGTATVTLARATRSAVAAARGSAAGRAVEGPAVVVLGPDGAVRSRTAAALELLGDVEEPGTQLALRAVTAVVAAGAPSASSRLRLDGEWVVLRASSLPGPEGEDGRDGVVVTIDPAVGPDMTDLLVAAHGLTTRERDVCREVLAGRSTSEIAARLFIASHTVQDHLKSIFDKTGVRSRRELVASMGGDGAGFRTGRGRPDGPDGARPTPPASP